MLRVWSKRYVSCVSRFLSFTIHNILFQFGDIDLLSTFFDDSVSIGIQNTAQDIALQIHFEDVADREFFNEAYLITPEPSSFILFSLGLVALVVAAAMRRRSSTN